MKITKSQLKQIIKEELESVVQEQKDPENLQRAARYWNGIQKLSQELGGILGVRPPEPHLDGVDALAWLASKTGFTEKEIMEAAGYTNL